MATIQLNEEWKVKGEKYCWTLIRASKSREYIEGYYTSLEDAIQGFVEKDLRLSNASSVKELLQHVKCFQSSLNRVLQPLKLKVVERRK